MKWINIGLSRFCYLEVALFALFSMVVMRSIFTCVYIGDFASATRSMEVFFIRLPSYKFNCFHLVYSLISNTARPNHAINHLLIVCNAFICMFVCVWKTSFSSSNSVFDLLKLSVFILNLLIVSKLSFIEFIVLSWDHCSHVLQMHLMVNFSSRSMLLNYRLWLHLNFLFF